MKLEDLKKKVEDLIDTYFYEKTKDCNFDGWEELPDKFDRYVKDVISTCNVEIEYLDREIDVDIEDMESEREYMEACDRLGVPYRNDI